MCGIFGQVGHAPAPAACVTALHHRGPDDHGMEVLPVGGTGHVVTLGQCRLSIVDLSAAGHQPMSNEDGTVWITFNGEIYNFQSLRSELVALGHRFVSRTDTEVLVHGFEQWGEALFPRLLGMFAVGIWDRRTRMLTVARDRVGKKPLFYHEAAGRFCFASEIKSLLAAGDIPLDPDPAAIHDYLTYLYFPYPQTAFRAIRKLAPATVMTVVLGEDGTLCSRQRRYWDAADAVRRPPASFAAAVDEARSLIEDAVRVRLMSDVPLGVFLSGGLDSGSIAACAVKHTGPALKTFSIGFAEMDGFNESAEAAASATMLGTDHHALTVDADCAEHITTVVRAFDEPFGNPTAILAYLLSQSARRHVTVALSGDGGDEVFGGYVRYRGAMLAGSYRRLPAFLSQHLFPNLAGAMGEDTAGHHTRRRLREFVSSAWKEAPEMYLDWVGYFGADEKCALYTPEFAAAAGESDSGDWLRGLFRDGAALDPFNELGYVDIRSFLTGNCLEYGDRMSMANGLEVRCPFADHRLIEFGLGLPAEWKNRSGISKRVLREAMRGILPESVLRKKKTGFNPPMPRWLKRELRPMVSELLSETAVRRRGFFRPAVVRSLLDEHDTGRRDHALKIWALLILEVWCRMYIDPSPSQSLPAPLALERAEVLA